MADVYIGSSTFIGCAGLHTVHLPSRLKQIEAEAFSGCVRLAAIELPPSVEVIGTSAFAGCGLREISIPTSVRLIHEGAFRGCGALVDVIPTPGTPGDVKYKYFHPHFVCGGGSSRLAICANAFRDCSMLEKVQHLVDCAEVVGPSAFQGTAVKAVVVPSGVRTIGTNAFSETPLAAVTFVPSVVEETLDLSPVYPVVSTVMAYLHPTTTIEGGAFPTVDAVSVPHGVLVKAGGVGNSRIHRETHGKK
jgi:hypothetical protein